MGDSLGIPSVGNLLRFLFLLAILCSHAAYHKRCIILEHFKTNRALLTVLLRIRIKKAAVVAI